VSRAELPVGANTGRGRDHRSLKDGRGPFSSKLCDIVRIRRSCKRPGEASGPSGEIENCSECAELKVQLGTRDEEILLVIAASRRDYIERPSPGSRREGADNPVTIIVILIEAEP
jgi:hypothetical protein